MRIGAERSSHKFGVLLQRVRATLVETERSPTPTAVKDAIRECGVVAGPTTVADLVDRLTAEMVGAGALAPLLAGADVTDVLVNGPDSVWIDAGAGLRPAGLGLGTEADVRALAQRLAAQAGRRLDDSSPFVDAALADGVRLHAVLAPIARPGTLISLRKHRSRIWTLPDWVVEGSLSAAAAAVLQSLVRNRVAFLVTGGTGSGKTSLLTALLGQVPDVERIIVAEETPELRVKHPHTVFLSGRPDNSEGAGLVTLSDLVRQALRMRPDRIVVGEVRGAEVVDLLSAMNTGHEGCAGTVHANSPDHVVARLEALGLAAGLGGSAVGSQIAAGLEAVIHVRRAPSGQRHVLGTWGVSGSGEDVVVRQVHDFSLPAPFVVADHPILARIGAVGPHP